MRARLVTISLTVLLVASLGFAAAKSSAIKLTTVFQTPAGFGVFSDTGNAYIHGIDGVQSYFGSNGGNVNLVTYSTPRKIHLKFDTSQAAWQNSHLPSDFQGTVDLYGINYYGQFTSMNVDTTALLPASLQFKSPDGVTTWELNYASLVVSRIDATTWRITSDVNAGDGFWPDDAIPSDVAKLSMIRKRGSVAYGNVNMPITYTVTMF
jgi:hypothetical protein